MARKKPDPLRTFEELMSDITEAVIELEFSDGVGLPCPCGAGERTTRCCECLHFGLMCDTCIIDRHRSSPLHWVEKWNGVYFTKISQSSIGQKIRLGHNGGPCPSKPSAGASTSMIAVDLNGIHKCSVEFCFCYNSAPTWRQLLAMGFFPGSVERPETMFTIQFMKLTHLLSTIGHISAMDLTTVMRRLTNGAFQADTPVSRYYINPLAELTKDYRTFQRAFELHFAYGEQFKPTNDRGLPLALEKY